MTEKQDNAYISSILCDSTLFEFCRKSVGKYWPVMLSTANVIKDPLWQINIQHWNVRNISYDLKKCILVKPLLSRTSFQMNASVHLCVSLPRCLIDYLTSKFFIHTHTLIHTLTCAFILSQLQPSGAVALIGVQQRGAAMAAASIVNMTACYLCMRQHREKEKMKTTARFPGLIISVQLQLVCHINIRTWMHLCSCVHPGPARGPAHTHSAWSLWCSRTPLHSHRCPFHIHSHLNIRHTPHLGQILLTDESCFNRLNTRWVEFITSRQFT